MKKNVIRLVSILLVLCCVTTAFADEEFETVDLDALDVSLMEKKDIQYLNEYHKAVYEKISPYLTEEEAAWLKEATREV